MKTPTNIILILALAALLFIAVLQMIKTDDRDDVIDMLTTENVNINLDIDNLIIALRKSSYEQKHFEPYDEIAIDTSNRSNGSPTEYLVHFPVLNIDENLKNEANPRYDTSKLIQLNYVPEIECRVFYCDYTGEEPLFFSSSILYPAVREEDDSRVFTQRNDSAGHEWELYHSFRMKLDTNKLLSSNRGNLFTSIPEYKTFNIKTTKPCDNVLKNREIGMTYSHRVNYGTGQNFAYQIFKLAISKNVRPGLYYICFFSKYSNHLFITRNKPVKDVLLKINGISFNVQKLIGYHRKLSDMLKSYSIPEIDFGYLSYNKFLDKTIINQVDEACKTAKQSGNSSDEYRLMLYYELTDMIMNRIYGNMEYLPGVLIRVVNENENDKNDIVNEYHSYLRGNIHIGTNKQKIRKIEYEE